MYLLKDGMKHMSVIITFPWAAAHSSLLQLALQLLVAESNAVEFLVIAVQYWPLCPICVLLQTVNIIYL